MSTGRSLTWHGVRTVALLELRLRVRSSRWPAVLGAWVVTVYGVVGLLWLATRQTAGTGSGVFYGTTLFLVLGLGLLVVPSLTSGSINGDRDHGVLATLQTTLLTPAEIVVGKLLAACAVAGVLLLAAMPVLVFAVVTGGVGLGALLLALLALCVVLTATCAAGLAYSTLTARPATSVVLTYLTVGALAVGTLVVFAAATPLTLEETERRVVVPAPVDADSTGLQTTCVETTQTRPELHTERIWPLLALNPFVVVADAGPPPTTPTTSFEPLGAISDGARAARRGVSDDPVVECWNESDDAAAEVARDRDELRGYPLWPLGLAGYGVAGVAAVMIAVRRTRTPVRALPKGIRIG